MCANDIETSLLYNLKKIRLYDEMIKDKLAEIEHLRTLAEKVTASTEGERVQASGSHDKVGDNVASIVELQRELDDDVAVMIETRKHCLAEISKMDDRLIAGILYKKFFEFKTWEQIAEDLDRSSRWVQKVYKRYCNNSKKLSSSSL